MNNNFPERLRTNHWQWSNTGESATRFPVYSYLLGIIWRCIVFTAITLQTGWTQIHRTRAIEARLAELYPERDTPIVADPIRSERSRTLREFPDGSLLLDLQFSTSVLRLREADGVERDITFDFTGYPTTIYVMHAGPDGKIYGSSDHPSHLFVYDPETDELVFYPDETINFKALRTQGQYLFGGHYAGGILWRLDTSAPISMDPVASIPGRRTSAKPVTENINPNPHRLGAFAPHINIPRGAFAHPDGRHILISGQPGYGFVGGGLGIHDLETGETTLLNHKQLLPHYSTMAMTALPDGSLLCGTSPDGGHGTAPVHNRAQLYILDWKTRQVAWQSGPLAHRAILSLLAGPDSLYYYVTDNGTLVVLDIDPREEKPDPIEALMNLQMATSDLPVGMPEPDSAPSLQIDLEKATVHRTDLSAHGNHLLTQAMIVGPDGMIYLALSRAILRITPGTFAVEVLAIPEGGISAGLGIVNGRIYFAGRGRVQSLAIPKSGISVDPKQITDHGAPVRSSENRGMTAAVDGHGNRVVLIWLMNGGTDRILVINAETGATSIVRVEPFAGDNAFSVWHSTRGLFYSHFGNHFYEFDPKTMRFSFAQRTAGRCAMSMHEDRNGTIWASLYSGAGLVSFNPQTREVTNHGSINREGWGQYTTYMATDSAGWVYIGIGNTLGQLVAYNPATGERRAYVPPDDRLQGVGQPFTATDGKAYASAPGWPAHELYAGEAMPLDAIPQRKWAEQLGDYEPEQGDYFVPPHQFRGWELREIHENLLEELLGDALNTRPGVVRAPTGEPAEADRWLWKNDVHDRFDLLIRARDGHTSGMLHVKINDYQWFAGPTPFERDTSGTLRLPIPEGVLRQDNNTLQIVVQPEEQNEARLDDEPDQPLAVYYAVFKRLP